MRVITQVALVSLFALAACGPKKKAKQPTDDIEQDTVETPQEVAWPTPQRACGDTGNWCGPLGQVKAVAHDTGADEGGGSDDDDSDDALGGDVGIDDGEGGGDDEGGSVAESCPDAFMREPYNYSLDVEATTSSMSGNCCYSYVDDHCRQP